MELIGVLVGGGPAPGINSVISAVSIAAQNSGFKAVGIVEGFARLVRGELTLKDISPREISRIHNRGGSYIGTSRTNPAGYDLGVVVRTLLDNSIDGLITIGGNDTALSAHRISKHSGGKLRVIHVPKTIDNDLPLPGGMPTFGFETAKALGTSLVLNLMEDAVTTGRWYVTVVMGRNTGHLALGIGKAARASITVIPEELPETCSLDFVLSRIFNAVFFRLQDGKRHGVIVVSEGVAEKLDVVSNRKRDPYGNVHLGEIPLASMIKDALRKRFPELMFSGVTLGYELRSAVPIPFDIDYAQTLGYGAAQHLIQGKSGGMICLDGGKLNLIDFEKIIGQDGKIRQRFVDLDSEYYRVARAFMFA